MKSVLDNMVLDALFVNKERRIAAEAPYLIQHLIYCSEDYKNFLYYSQLQR